MKKFIKIFNILSIIVLAVDIATTGYKMYSTRTRKPRQAKPDATDMAFQDQD